MIGAVKELSGFMEIHFTEIGDDFGSITRY